jgi:3-isopropylmalate/(R)-2-methylmalate dehydratase small subunit
MEKKEWIVEGNVWKVGNNINTESIQPSQWQQAGPEAMKAHCAELLIPEFPKKVKKDDIWVAGSNFGCSSSRNAAGSLKDVGIGVIVCHSASRICYRNSINTGMPIFEIGQEVNKINMGDKLKVNILTGEIENLTTGVKIQSKPLPGFLLEIIEAGGARAKIMSEKSKYPMLK